VIALTPHTRSDDRRHAVAAGFNAALAKPIAPAELIAILTTLTGRRARA
jgi:CheY-like chemotaxis protein